MQPYVLMLGGAFAFAIMGALTHAAGENCDWQLIALVRSMVALLIVASLAIGQRNKFVFFRPWTLWVRSLAGSLSVLCNFYALSHLPIADALTLTNMFPVWIAILSWPVLGRVPERDVWLGLLLAMIGVYVMERPAFMQGDLGTLAAVTGSFTSAVALIGLHRLKHIPPNAVVAHFSAVSIFVVLAATVVLPLKQPAMVQITSSWKIVALLLGVGLAATIGQMLLTRAFAAGAPARVSVVGLSQIGFAMIFDIVIWHRTLEWNSIVGMLLVIGPTIWLTLRQTASAGGPANR